MQNTYVKSQSNFISRTMLTMALGLLITFLTSVGINMITDGRFINPAIFFTAAAIEFIVVIYLGRRIDKLSITSATLWFYAYSILNGVTLSVALLAYGIGTAATAFVLASLMFFSSAMIGITTKKDLSTMGRVLIMGVAGLIFIGIIQTIFPAAFAGNNLLISLLGIVIFCGLTAWDMQKVKHFHQVSYGYDGEVVAKYSIIAALELYLDFINIFLYVLRLLSNKD